MGAGLFFEETFLAILRTISMPRPRKIIRNKTVVFITTSLEEGLLLPPNALVNLIIQSYLARAQTLYPIKICHYIFLANHFHLILVVENPEDVPSFMERFKCEMAHAINRLIGRNKRTVWCEGYDSPVLLDPQAVIKRIAYIYSNPSRDELEDRIDLFPGLSSWDVFTNKASKESMYIRLRRFSIPTLEEEPNTNPDFLAKRLTKKSKLAHKLIISPDAWMDCFEMTDTDREEANIEIVDLVRETEAERRAIRKMEGRKVMGRQRLISQPMNLEYRSKRSGRRMLCIGSSKNIRRSFLNEIYALIDEAKTVYANWKKGDYSIPYPPGLFPPSMPKLVEAVSFFE